MFDPSVRRFVITAGLALGLTNAIGQEGNHWTVRFGSAPSPAKLREMKASPDSKLVVLTTNEGTLYLIRLADGEQVAQIKHTDASALAFSKDSGRLLAIGDFQNQILDGRTLRMIRGFDHEKNAGVSVGIVLQERGEKILVSSVIPNSPAALAGMPAVGDVVVAVAVGEEPDPNKVRVDDEWLKVTSRSIMRAQRMLSRQPGSWVRIEYLPSGKNESEVIALRVAKVTSIDGKATAVPFQPSQGEAVSHCAEFSQIIIRNAATGQMLGAIQPRHVSIDGGTRFLLGRYLAFAGKYRGRMQRGLEVYELETGSRVAEADISLNGIGVGTFHPTRDEVWIGGKESIEVFNLKEKKWSRSIPLFRTGSKSKGTWTGPPTAEFVVSEPFKGLRIAVSKNGLIAVGSSDGYVRLLDDSTGEFLRELPRIEEKREIEGITFTESGSHLLYFIRGTLHIAERGTLGIE